MSWAGRRRSGRSAGTVRSITRYGRSFQFSFLGENSLTVVQNGRDARIDGVETDINYVRGRPDPQCRGGLHRCQDQAEHLRSRVRTTAADCDGFRATRFTAPKGTRLPVTPKFKVTGTARYAWDMGPGKAHVQAGVVHQGSARSALEDRRTTCRRVSCSLHAGRSVRRLRLGQVQLRAVRDERLRQAQPAVSQRVVQHLYQRPHRARPSAHDRAEGRGEVLERSEPRRPAALGASRDEQSVQSYRSHCLVGALLRCRGWRCCCSGRGRSTMRIESALRRSSAGACRCGAADHHARRRTRGALWPVIACVLSAFAGARPGLPSCWSSDLCSGAG